VKPAAKRALAQKYFPCFQTAKKKIQAKTK
jgi:hypothetical protein